MAGRPRKMAEKAAELDKMAERLEDAIHDAMPMQYLENMDDHSPIAEAWRACSDTAMTLGDNCTNLTVLLNKRVKKKKLQQSGGTVESQDGL